MSISIQKYQMQIFKTSLRLPLSLSNVGLNGEVARLPFHHRWHLRQLMYVHRLSNLQPQKHICKRIFNTVLEMTLKSKNPPPNWITHTVDLFNMYDLEFDQLKTLKRQQWKNLVDRQIRKKWIQEWQQEMNNRKIPRGFIRQAPPRWEPYLHDKYAREIILLRNNMLLKNTYALWRKEDLRQLPCRHCHMTNVLSDLHILRDCPAFDTLRQELMTNTNTTDWKSWPTDKLIQFLLGYGKPLHINSPHWKFLTKVIHLSSCTWMSTNSRKKKRN